MNSGRTQTRSARRAWEYLPEFAQAQLPRYTSYPPANRFSNAVGPSQAEDATRSLPANATLSLYLHVPFCKKLCWYCGCNTSVPTAADPVQSYVDALLGEIAAVARMAPAEARVTHLHFGGGSPDILTPLQIESIFEGLRTSFRFASFPEIATELDPRGISPDVINAFAANGLTRASLGVQVLDHDIQKRINRVQPIEQVVAAISGLRAGGVESVNIDMMYGLPGQTIEHVVETARFAACQDVDRVAVFGYAHVPWMKKHQNGILIDQLPADEQRFRQAEAAANALERSGYLPVGFDHFAAPGDSLSTAERSGTLRRNFQGYTDDAADALIGFGASAISSLPGLIYQNTPDTASYRASIQAGASPVQRGIVLSADDRSIAALIERVLCDFEVMLPRDLQTWAMPRLAPLLDAGLAEFRANRLSVTSRGKPYVRNVAACLDPGFVPQAGRHSLAV